MNIQSEQKTFDRALQKLEFDMEWNLEKSSGVRKKLDRQMRREQLRSQSLKMLGYVATVGVAFAFLFLVISLSGSSSEFFNESLVSGTKSEKLYTMEMINGKETPVLTNKGMESVVYPMDAYNNIETITGEPTLAVSVENTGKKEKMFTQAFYPTTSQGRFISVHYTTNDMESVEKMAAHFLPSTPLYGRVIREINIAGKRGILYEPTTEYGSAQLFIITEKYVYYMSNSGITEKKQGDTEELVQLAKLFNFEAER